METVHVIATTSDGTRAALGAAIPLAKGSGAALVVVVPHIVPDGDADAPGDSTAFFVERYQRIVTELGGAASVVVCHCRSIGDLVATLAAGEGPIVIGGPAGRWLTSPEERFANRLAHLGHRVIFVTCGPNLTQRRVAPAVAAALVVTMAMAAAVLA